MIKGRTLSASERNGVITTKPYRWWGIPDWDPAAAAAPPPKAPRPPKQPWQPKPCGTDAGYARHTRKHEPICDPCRMAHRAAQRKRQLP